MSVVAAVRVEDVESGMEDAERTERREKTPGDVGVGGDRDGSPGPVRTVDENILERLVKDLRGLGDGGGDNQAGEVGVLEPSWTGGDVEGARYVMPTALNNPEMSFFCGMKATVTSPASIPSTFGCTAILTTASGPGILESSHLGIVTTLSLSKYLQLRMMRAEAGSARMMVLVPVGGSWRSVASLQ